MTREAAIAFYTAHPKTPPAIADQLRDIRLLSKTELKRILMWHARMRKARADLLEAMNEAAADGEQGSGSASDDQAETANGDEEDSDAKLDRQLGAEIERADARRKRRLRKLRKERSKVRMEAALGMHVSFEQDTGDNVDLFQKSTVDKIADSETQRALRSGRDNVLDRLAQLEAEKREQDDMVSGDVVGTMCIFCVVVGEVHSFCFFVPPTLWTM